MHHDTDILIVGAGPTGLTLALELAAQIRQQADDPIASPDPTISFRIIDKEPTRSDKSRALAVQPRTLELLNRHGSAATDLSARGQPASGVTMFVRGRRAVDIDVTDLGFDDTRFPLPLIVSQAETERFLEERLAAYGVAVVERGVAATKVEQAGDGVVVTLVKGTAGENEQEEEEIVRCRYVVGCDGAHSAVRHASGLKFDGAPYPQDFILADTHIDWPPLERLQGHMVAFLAGGLMVMFPFRDDGLVRLVVSRPGSTQPTGSASSLAPGGQQQAPEPTLEDFQQAFDSLYPGQPRGRLHSPVWMTRFRLHHRGVDAYREGRLLVAGDAAHIHSPAGGQGMNAGIQDAVNLGWKLAAAVRGEKARRQGAGEGDGDVPELEILLDSYHAERYPVGKALLRGTDRLFSWATWTNPVWIAVRNALVPLVVPWLVRDRGRRREGFRFMSEFGIAYREGALVGTAAGFRGPVRGGDRPPDGKILGEDGGEVWLMDLCRGVVHHLLLFSGTGANAASAAELQRARDGFLNSRKPKSGVPVHIVYAVAKPDGAEGCVDIGGQLHELYGFKGPGYVYIRPDAYVGHIGPLDSLGAVMSAATR